MKLKILAATIASLALLAACEHVSLAPKPVVSWDTSAEPPIAKIVKQPGMEVAFVSGQGVVERISVPDDDSGNQGVIQLQQMQFLIKLLNQDALFYSGPNNVPCTVGDDCVPPVPPQLLEVEF